VSEILESAGWELNEQGLYEDDGETIKLIISTNNTETLRNTGEYLRTKLRESVFDVTL
jgi:hypothetical protein